MDIALVADGLVKQFGEKTAVNHLHLAVPRGSWFGVVGPNGAGKTTSIRMMVGLLRPDEGTVLVNGAAVWPDPTELSRAVGVNQLPRVGHGHRVVVFAVHHHHWPGRKTTY